MNKKQEKFMNLFDVQEDEDIAEVREDFKEVRPSPINSLDKYFQKKAITLKVFGNCWVDSTKQVYAVR